MPVFRITPLEEGVVFGRQVCSPGVGQLGQVAVAMERKRKIFRVGSNSYVPSVVHMLKQSALVTFEQRVDSPGTPGLDAEVARRESGRRRGRTAESCQKVALELPACSCIPVLLSKSDGHHEECGVESGLAQHSLYDEMT